LSQQETKKALFIREMEVLIMNEYEAMANDFLAKTETVFNVCDYLGTVSKWGSKMDKWEVELFRNNKSWVFPFYMGLGHNGAEPTAYDVLACLTKYEVGTFKDFCAEFGYERFNDYDCKTNMESYKTYKAVKSEYKKVCEMFGDVLDDLCEIA
jgi:hypothetical protein